ncbi:hypothetical protein [Nitratireductor indicus]|uniref:hypothetical protein n=1 Tax=Nitratireductor indicus TaxID=721133 RepID=UPI002876ACAF|nr:hypothetical protein [Nitratireductor indicus]MDS1138577.1 hypothetical protein [Nitratireductor indicus]
MPLDRERPIEGGYVGVGSFDAPDPSFTDVLGAAYRQENLIGSYITSARRGVKDFNAIDPNYDVFSDIKGYERYAERFETVYNKQAADAVKSDIDKETRDRKTLQAGGWVGVGLGMTAAVTDPTILLPGGAFVQAGKIGYKSLRTAMSVGTAAAIASAAQEAGLQATQELRTAGESAINIGGSAVLGGLIGMAGAKFLSKAEWDRVSRSLEEQLAEDVPNPAEVTQTIINRMQSAGAAAVDDIKLEDLGIGGGRAAQVVAKATEAAKINPGIQTMFSPSKKVREIYTKMVDNPVYSRMNMEGRSLGSDVENLVKLYERGKLGEWISSSRSLYKEARQSGFEGTKTDFYERVAKAGRRGDVDELGNVQVTKAAQQARELVFDPLLERAIKNGLLPEDVKVTTAASYVTRLWNRQRLIGEEDRFREIARNYFMGELRKVPADKRPDFVSKADMDDYVEEIVTSVFNNLTGRGRGDVPDWLVPVKRGPLKERTFNIPDEMIEDFLENDMEMILRRYSRTMAAEVELTEKFGRADMKEQFDEIRREYDELSKAAKTTNEREKLRKAMDRDVKNLEAFRDMIRGTYRAAEEGSDWSKITRAALAWNYMRLLGGVTLTSLADTARLIGVHGVRSTMREAIPSLVSNVKAIKISKADARNLGAVTERVLQSRLASLADLNDPYRYHSGFDRYISNATNLFSKATGLGWWNDTMKQMAAVMTQNRMARNALDWSKAGERERAYMAFLGIDENMAGRIARQIEKHGEESGGVWGANVGQWDDELAQRAWAAALNKDVDRTIITKGIADTPLWMKTNWGRLIMQFKSFALASHQRVLIAGLQERPQRFAEQMVFGTAIGMLVSYLKMIERGDFDRAEDLVNNPGKWVADGLDRTGILSLPFEMTNTADKVVSSYGGPNIGINRLFSEIAGDENTSGGATRYASRNATGAVAGPSVGLWEDLAQIATALAKQDMNKGAANALIRQIPGATLPGARTAIHVGLKPALHEAVK